MRSAYRSILLISVLVGRGGRGGFTSRSSSCGSTSFTGCTSFTGSDQQVEILEETGGSTTNLRACRCKAHSILEDKGSQLSLLLIYLFIYFN